MPFLEKPGQADFSGPSWTRGEECFSRLPWKEVQLFLPPLILSLLHKELQVALELELSAVLGQVIY